MRPSLRGRELAANVPEWYLSIACTSTQTADTDLDVGHGARRPAPLQAPALAFVTKSSCEAKVYEQYLTLLFTYLKVYLISFNNIVIK